MVDIQPMEIKRPFSDAEWFLTPEPVRKYIEALERNILQLTATVSEHTARIEKLEQQQGRNSQNSNQPPSSDSPFKKPERKKKKTKQKRGGQKGHKGHRQQLLDPTESIDVKPTKCSCGSCQFDRIEPYYTHQEVELPEIQLDVTHYILHKGFCRECGKTVVATVDSEHRFGYGPRMSALIAELSGMQGISRRSMQQFLSSVLDLPISTGAIQKVIDRMSMAITPAYDKIAETARNQQVGYIDETSWFKCGKLQWLWVMVTATVALYLVHPKRSGKALKALIKDWQGILVSDNFSVYKNWIHKRQNCLAHFIRKAKKLSESADDQLSKFGDQMHCHLRLLCHYAKAPPSNSQWTIFYVRLVWLIILYSDADNEAGKLARSIGSVMDTLWTFLREHGVEPTNNRAERALRFGVIWRKRCFGSQSDKGQRWVERILSLKETCRIKNKPPFPVLVDLAKAHFKDQQPDLAWIS